MSGIKKQNTEKQTKTKNDSILALIGYDYSPYENIVAFQKRCEARFENLFLIYQSVPHGCPAGLAGPGKKSRDCPVPCPSLTVFHTV